MTRFKWVCSALCVSVSAAVLGVGGVAQAAENVTLRYNEEVETFSVSSLVDFARTGQTDSAELQAFFERNPRLGQVARDILVREIYISPRFIERNLDTSIGQFVLTQLNRLLSDPSAAEDLAPIETALRSSFEDDNRVSFLELLNEFPENNIYVNLSDLEPVYRDVSAFVERIEPALAAVRDVLQDIVCECETPTATGTESDDNSGGGGGTNCVMPAPTAVEPVAP